MQAASPQSSGPALRANPPSEGALIPTLDGWRCIAISFVLFAHSWGWLGLGTAKLARLLHYPGIHVHIDRFGPIGVNVFFCISGFLITSQLIRQGVSLRRFYVRRAFRILPPALLYLTVVAALGALGYLTVASEEVIACLLFWRNYYETRAWFTGHFWSLSIEEQFYLMWPAVLLCFGTARSRTLAILGVVGVVVWRQTHWPLQGFAVFGTGMRLDGIICGSIMALSWDKLQPFFKRMPAIIVPVGAFAYFAADAWGAQLQGATDFVQAILTCLLIASTVTFPSRLVSRILEFPVLTWVGRLSYSVYLWQQLFLCPSGAAHWQLPFRLAGIFVAAWLSFTFVESPLRAVGRRIAGGRAKNAAVVTAQ